jgi:hypothetical protein
MEMTRSRTATRVRGATSTDQQGEDPVFMQSPYRLAPVPQTRVIVTNISCEWGKAVRQHQHVGTVSYHECGTLDCGAV